MRDPAHARRLPDSPPRKNRDPNSSGRQAARFPRNVSLPQLNLRATLADAPGRNAGGTNPLPADLIKLTLPFIPGPCVRKLRAVQGVPHFVRVLIGSNPFSAPCSSDAPELAKLIE